jgi:DNA-binding MarR family transcriptional regulator
MHTVLALVQRGDTNLSTRQLSIFLICYLEQGPHTVRSLAKHLGINKPAVTRALDRLAEYDFIRRKEDPNDRRSVHALRTVVGAAFLREFRGFVSKADTTLRREALPAPLPGKISASG